MSLPLTESLLTLSEAARELPNRPHLATLFRWVNPGCRGVRLEVVKLGGKTLTSREALQRFADRLSGGEPAPMSPKQQADRTARVAKARAELRARGV